MAGSKFGSFKSENKGDPAAVAADVVARRRDPYEVLGVGRNATEQEIKSTFRRMALKSTARRRGSKRCHMLLLSCGLQENGEKKGKEEVSQASAEKGELRPQDPQESAGRILLLTPLLFYLGPCGFGRGVMLWW